MDHAPYADQFILPRVEVPYLDKYEYDHGDFASFPQRTDLCNEDGILDSTRPISDIAAMVQAWLYFGLLEAYNGKPLDKKALISKTQPYLLDSTELPVILIDITRQMRKSSIQKYNKHLEALQAKLLIAVKAISEVDIADIDTLRRKYNSASAAIFLSIRVLLNTLCLRFHVTNWPCWNSVVKPRDLGTVLGHAQDPLRSFSAYLLMERMQQAGWCARQITQLLQTSDYCTGYYFSSIRRQEPGNISHGNCRTEYCIAYNTDPNAYIIRHVGRCRCSEFIEAPFNALERIIRDGDIPLIKIRKGRLDTSIKLEVVKLTPRSNYTAISHVWIDGLGNPKANSLPRCQLEKLYKHLIALETSRSFLSKASSAVGAMSDPLFWMDTLCIPVKPHDELKKMQIDRMALIYASARQVLVLDEELSNVNCTTEPSELLNARIVSSKWNTRCWTLQEGALARICFYQFQDAAFCTSSFPRSRLTVFCKNAIRGMRSPLWSLKCFWYVLRNIRQFSSRSWWSNTFLGIYTSTFLSDLTAQLHQGLCTAAHESIQSDLVMADEHKFRYYNPQLHALLESQPKRFARTWSNVGKRSTTMAEDIHVVIANLTGFRVSQIMDELSSPVERTKIMLYCVGEFPLDILFNDCPRAEEAKGNTNRWVPSCPGSEPLITNVKLRWGPTGLVILDSHNSPNLFLVEGGAVNHRFCFKVRQGTYELWYSVTCHQPAGDLLSRNPRQVACLLLPSFNDDNFETRTMQGARLITKGAQDSNAEILACYDCRLIFTVSKSPPTDEELAIAPPVTASQTFRKLVIEQVIDSSSRDKFATKLMYYTSMEEGRKTWQIMTSRLLFGSIMAFVLLIAIMMITVNMAVALSRDDPDKQVKWIAPLFALLNIAFFLVGAFFMWRRLQVRAYDEWKASFDVNVGVNRWQYARIQRPSLLRRIWRLFRGLRRARMATGPESDELQPLLEPEE